MIVWGDVWQGAGLAGLAIVVGLALYAVVRSGKFGELADLFLRVVGLLIDRWTAKRAATKAAAQTKPKG